MKCPISAAVLFVGIALPVAVAAKEKKQSKEPKVLAPVGWLDLQSGSRDFSVPLPDLQKANRPLPPGSLLPVFHTKEKHGRQLGQVGALNLETGKSELGWVEINATEMEPPDAYPLDSELLGMLGAPYLDDFTAAHTDIARFLLKQAEGPPALLCYVFTAPLSMAKLIIFTPTLGKFIRGAELNIPMNEMDSGITSITVKDLLGDGSACVITKEPFREQAQTYGTNLRIRKINGGQFQDLWQAPVDFHNLSQYSPKIQILQPPVMNIGTPGTVTTGEVTFRPHGNGQEPVWKGKVEFHVFGREKAVESINIEKPCPWDGQAFAPLR